MHVSSTALNQIKPNQIENRRRFGLVGVRNGAHDSFLGVVRIHKTALCSQLRIQRYSFCLAYTPAA
jgi:hypothetical protein